jgi:PIN domain nuclease of toxin-antitoxin system
MRVMLDTHIVVALYEGRTAGLGRRALRAIDREELSYSPAVLLELELLHEIGRIRQGGAHIAHHLGTELGIECAADRFLDVVARALPLAYTRDPFDRLIIAHAELLDAPLVTLDERMRQHYSRVL